MTQMEFGLLLHTFGPNLQLLPSRLQTWKTVCTISRMGFFCTKVLSSISTDYVYALYAILLIIYSAVFLVLQESMLEKGLPGTTYQDLHKKRVQFSKQERPCFQLLSRHATQAFDYPGNAQWMGIEEASFRRVLQVGSPQKQD
mmetsp:Transcript_36175/g.91004  ORF Transcript_36175/g.91004 Transcript_36175/m.91004 type:complete len:143 (+) Transcript_36175:283-711(+)